MIRRECADVSLAVKKVSDRGLTCLLCACGDRPWDTAFLYSPSLFTFFVFRTLALYFVCSHVEHRRGRCMPVGPYFIVELG